MTIENHLLKTAMEEVKTILKKHDIAGHVVLSSGEQCEFLNWIGSDGDGPTWSCLNFIDNGIRLKASASKDHNERFKLNSTVKMIFSMQGLLTNQIVRFFQITELIESKMDVTHGETLMQTHVDERNNFKGDE